MLKKYDNFTDKRERFLYIMNVGDIKKFIGSKTLNQLAYMSRFLEIADKLNGKYIGQAQNVYDRLLQHNFQSTNPFHKTIHENKPFTLYRGPIPILHILDDGTCTNSTIYAEAEIYERDLYDKAQKYLLEDLKKQYDENGKAVLDTWYYGPSDEIGTDHYPYVDNRHGNLPWCLKEFEKYVRICELSKSSFFEQYNIIGE